MLCERSLGPVHQSDGGGPDHRAGAVVLHGEAAGRVRPPVPPLCAARPQGEEVSCWAHECRKLNNLSLTCQQIPILCIPAFPYFHYCQPMVC